MLDFSFFLTDFFLDVNNRRSVHHFFLMLLGRLTLQWMALPFLTRYFGWGVKLTPTLPHPLPRNYLEGRVKIPYIPRVFVGLPATNDPRLLYPRPTTISYSHVIQPKKIVPVSVFPVDFNKFVNYFILVWHSDHILSNKAQKMSLF